MFAHPIYSTSGDYPPEVRARVDNNSRAEGYNTSRLPKFTQEEIDYIKGQRSGYKSNHFGACQNFLYQSVRVKSGATDFKCCIWS
jgi:lactase-phlorizin hydrolase